VPRAAQTPPLPFRDLEEVAAAVRKAGGRLSAPRRRVLEALFAAEGPVSASYLAGGLGGRGPEVDLASVYRSLEQLEELGVVRHVHVGHGPGLYGLVGDGEREFLVCEACGKVVAVDPSALERVRGVIRDDFGLEARFTHFPIHGRCADCGP